MESAQASAARVLLAAFVVESLLAFSTGSTDAMALRGADPSLASLYQQAQRSGTFACRDKSATIPASRLNDDFCDCFDGSDEPGTSACPSGTYYCKNRGHEPRILHSGFVNDGVCDCCDGSDEENGVCANECLASATAEIEELERRAASSAEGLKKRGSYIEKARQIRNGWASRMEGLEEEVEAAKKALDALREKKEAVEAEEEKVREKERAEREAREAEEAATRAAEGVDEAAGGEDDGAYPGDDPEDAYEGAPEYNYEEFAEDDGALGDEDDDGEEDPDEVGRRIASRWTTDPDAAGDHEEGTHDDYNGDHDYRAMGDYADADYASHGDDEPEPESEGDKIRAEFRKAETQHRELLDEHTSLTNKLSMDYGHMHVWASLEGRCISAAVDKYTYEICIGGEAKQKEGHGSTSLGKWAGGMTSGYLQYAGGAPCWQGPKRSFNVSLQCGADEELLGVEEPSRCEYTAVLRTPAACHEGDVAGSKAKLEELRSMVKQVHDEL